MTDIFEYCTHTAFVFLPHRWCKCYDVLRRFFIASSYLYCMWNCFSSITFCHQLINQWREMLVLGTYIHSSLRCNINTKVKIRGSNVLKRVKVGNKWYLGNVINLAFFVWIWQSIHQPFCIYAYLVMKVFNRF